MMVEDPASSRRIAVAFLNRLGAADVHPVNPRKAVQPDGASSPFSSYPDVLLKSSSDDSSS